MPRDVADWAARFDRANLPVLAATSRELEALRPAEESVDAHILAEAIGTDPLMSLKVFARRVLRWRLLPIAWTGMRR